jgi:prephenate dehydrogenase
MPDARFFKDAVIAVSVHPGASSDSVELVESMVQSIGSRLLFMDQGEADGLGTAVDLLPKLLALALIKTATSQTGWVDARKLANSAFFHGSEPGITGEADSLSIELSGNRENLIRVVDEYLDTLHEFRDRIHSNDITSLSETVETLQELRHTWLGHRLTNDWASIESPGVQAPPIGNILTRLFGVGSKGK